MASIQNSRNLHGRYTLFTTGYWLGTLPGLRKTNRVLTRAEDREFHKGSRSRWLPELGSVLARVPGSPRPHRALAKDAPASRPPRSGTAARPTRSAPAASSGQRPEPRVRQRRKGSAAGEQDALLSPWPRRSRPESLSQPRLWEASLKTPIGGLEGGKGEARPALPSANALARPPPFCCA